MVSLSQCPAMCFILSRDHKAATGFYRDQLGLEFVSDDGYAAVFKLPGGAELRLTTVPDWKAGEHTVFGWRVADIDAAMQALVARGIKPIIYPGFGQDANGIWTSPDGKARICWFNDPEGNNLSLTQAPTAG